MIWHWHFAKLVENLYGINTEGFDWWEWIYEDAATIGLKITGFDTDRGSYVEGDLTESALDVAKLIMENHGESCETYGTAKNFIEAEAKERKAFESKEDYDEEYEESDEYEELELDFERDLKNDYLAMLRRDLEYQTSREGIVETIEVNDYDFTEDGKLY